MIDPIAFWGLPPLFESFLWALSQTDTRGTAKIFQDSSTVSPPAKLSQQSDFLDFEQENVPTSADVNRSRCPQTVPCETNASRHGGFSSDPTWRINFSRCKKNKQKRPLTGQTLQPTPRVRIRLWQREETILQCKQICPWAPRGISLELCGVDALIAIWLELPSSPLNFWVASAGTHLIAFTLLSHSRDGMVSGKSIYCFRSTFNLLVLK